MLPEGGRLYLQTMVFGRKMIPVEEMDIKAPRESDGWYVALMARQFPGSLLPYGQEQVVHTARRADSTSCQHQRAAGLHRDDPPVAQALRGAELPKTLIKLRLVPRWLRSADFRLAFTSGVSANSVCFQRELLDHYRLVFEKR